MYFRYGRIRNGGNPNEALCKTCPSCGEESLSAIRSSTGSKTLSEWLIPVVSLLSRELSANGLFTMFISRSSPVLGPPSGTLAAGRLTSEAPSVPLAAIFLSLVSTDWLLAFDAIWFPLLVYSLQQIQKMAVSFALGSSLRRRTAEWSARPRCKQQLSQFGRRRYNVGV